MGIRRLRAFIRFRVVHLIFFRLFILAKPWILDQKPLLGRKKLGEVSLPVHLDHSTKRDSKRKVASTNHQQIRKMAPSEIHQHQQPMEETTMRENIPMEFEWL